VALCDKGDEYGVNSIQHVMTLLYANRSFILIEAF